MKLLFRHTLLSMCQTVVGESGAFIYPWPVCHYRDWSVSTRWFMQVCLWSIKKSIKRRHECQPRTDELCCLVRCLQGRCFKMHHLLPLKETTMLFWIWCLFCSNYLHHGQQKTRKLVEWSKNTGRSVTGRGETWLRNRHHYSQAHEHFLYRSVLLLLAR